jgi:alkylhydroperoxidase family enzyme
MQTQTTLTTQAPLIVPQAPAGDEARVDAILNAIQEHIGFIPDGLRLYSLSPPLLETFVGNVSYFNGGGTQLPGELTAMIRYLVSWQAGCSFCVDMNEGFLVNMSKDLASVRAARNNPELAPLSAKDKVLLKLALKSVNSPEFVSKDDLDQARRAGWQDRDLFDAVAQAANNRAFNMVLRTFKIEHQGAFA